MPKSKVLKVKKLLTCILWSTLMLFPLACSKTVFIGSTTCGFKKSTECKISPEKAYEIAKPYLQLSYEIRNKKRNYPSDKLEMNDYILLKGNYYYITRDNYPYKTFMAYLNHAVKVDSGTGEVIKPR